METQNDILLLHRDCLKNSEGIYIVQIGPLHCQASSHVWRVNKAISDVQQIKKQTIKNK